MHHVNDIIPVDVIKNGKETIFKAPSKNGVYKLHAFVFDGHGNVSTRSVSFKVEGASLQF